MLTYDWHCDGGRLTCSLLKPRAASSLSHLAYHRSFPYIVLRAGAKQPPKIRVTCPHDLIRGDVICFSGTNVTIQNIAGDVLTLSEMHWPLAVLPFRSGLLHLPKLPNSLRILGCPFGNVILPNFRLMVLTGVMPLLCVGSLRRVWMTGKVLMFRLMPGHKPFAKPNLTLPKERAGGLERNWRLYLPRHCLTFVKFFRALYRVPPGQTGWLLLARSSS